VFSKEYTIHELAEILHAEIVGDKFDLNYVIEKLVTDTRYRGIGKKSCFIALKTDRNDGHRYVNEAHSKGVRCFIIQDKSLIEVRKDSVYLVVEDDLEALQKLATQHRLKLTYPIIGITGSNGKTVVKEWMFQILSAKYSVFRSPKSYNSQIGVPFSLLGLPSKADYGIVEAGISKSGEMEKLRSIIQPTIGLITNVLSAHIENFQSAKELTAEKLQLFRDCETLVYRKDYGLIDEVVTNDESFSSLKKLSWSTNEDSNPEVEVEIRKDEDSSVISLSKRASN
jgi:UDP-N-acetylmuramyl pentapeptide synthase